MGEALGVGMGVCPECRASNEAGVAFCATCGTPLTAEAKGNEPLAAGTIIGAYRLLEVLGEGGMGRVYLAEHVKLGRRVAVKVLRAEFATSPAAVSRFFAEARAVNRISHENIVEITDFLEKQGEHNCYIMELLRGEDLGRRLLREPFLPVYAIVDIGAQIASALAAVHAAGIIHRDLKPDNIFLTERSGRPHFVKLLDFGVAKLSDPSGKAVSMHTTAAGQIIGTPEYMSPEQAGGQEIDLRTDIYALGVILYELVTGTLPFRAKSFGELVIKHMTVPPKRPSTYLGLPHAVPAELDELIVEMLAKDAGDRPHSMTDVEERLRDLLDTMDVPPQPRQWRPSGGNKAASTSAEFAVLKTPAPRLAGEPSAATAKTIDTAASNSGAIAVAPPAPAPRKLVRWPFLAGGAAALALALVIGIALGRAGSSHDEPAAPAAVALPAPAAAPTPAAPPPAPKPPAGVKIRFTSTPQGATVRLDGSATPLGTTPFTATLPRSDTPASVIVEKPGFAPITEPLELASDGALSASLSAAPAPAVATKPVEHKPPPAPKHPPATQRPLDRGGTMDVFGGK